MRIAVMGAAGRMGRELVRAVHATPGCSLAGGTEAPGSASVGSDLGVLAGLEPLGILLTSDARDLMSRADAALDFTEPKATVGHAALAAAARIVHVIGTTGFAAADDAAIESAARHATIIKSGNMSFGINLLAAIIRQAAAKLDPDYDIEIVEMHHRHKVDAPSGTALMFGKAAAEGRGIELEAHMSTGREAKGGPRRRGDIGFASLRGGSVPGDHTLVFAGPGERIELTHRAEERGIFARGAVKAALWGRGKGPGLYSMADVLGL